METTTTTAPLLLLIIITVILMQSNLISGSQKLQELELACSCRNAGRCSPRSLQQYVLYVSLWNSCVLRCDLCSWLLTCLAKCHAGTLMQYSGPAGASRSTSVGVADTCHSSHMFYIWLYHWGPVYSVRYQERKLLPWQPQTSPLLFSTQGKLENSNQGVNEGIQARMDSCLLTCVHLVFSWNRKWVSVAELAAVL